MTKIVRVINCHFNIYDASTLPSMVASLSLGLKGGDAARQQALEVTRTQKQQGYQAYALRLLGEIAARREPPEVELAEDYYRQALALAEAIGMRPLVAHCHRGLGTLYAAMGRRAEARAELNTAIDLYRAMEMTLWLPEAKAALAEVEGR
jgi:tetratricopeptide (TPR) repeat protein